MGWELEQCRLLGILPKTRYVEKLCLMALRETNRIWDIELCRSKIKKYTNIFR